MVETAPAATQDGVLAVVVTAGATDYLSECLAALRAQTRAPERVLIVTTDSRTEQLGALVLASGLPAETTDVVVTPAANLGQALEFGLARKAQSISRWLWLLHDDSIPAPDCLEQALGAAEESSSIAIVGCKQRRLGDPNVLIEVGITTSRLGRRLVDVPPGSVDQGQCDDRVDVLGVGTAGMLLSYDAWRLIGGFDPALGPFEDGLEFSRRARLAGFRVVVQPAAIVYHARAALLGLRGRSLGAEPRSSRSAGARRRAQLYRQFICLPLPIVPFAMLGAIVLGVVRALWRIATKYPGLAVMEVVAPFAVIARLGRIASGRARQRRSARLPRRSLRALQPTRSETWSVRRAGRLAMAGESDDDQLDDLELAHRDDVVRRRRIVVLVLTVLLAAISALVLGQLIRLPGLHGGALLPYDSSVLSLWRQAVSSWQPSGLGHAGGGDPLWFVTMALGVVTFGHTQAAINGFIVLTPLIAGLGAWFAAGAVARSVTLRAWATLMWVAAPTLWFALQEGRLGALVAHAFVPFALLALARAIGANRLDDFSLEGPAVAASATTRSRRAARLSRRERREDRRELPQYGSGSVAAAATAAILFGVVVAGAPSLALPLLAVLVLAALLAIRGRLRLILIAVGPFLAMAGVAVAVIRHPNAPWRVLLADSGLPIASEPASALQRLLGWPSAPPVSGWMLWTWLAAGVIALIGAALALARRGRRGWVIRACWLLVIGLIAYTAWLPGQITGVDTEAGLAVSPWLGGPISLLLATLITAVLAGADGWLKAAAGHEFGWRQITAIAAIVLAFAAPGWLMAGEGLRTRSAGELRERTTTVVPLIALQSSRSGDAARTMLLQVDPDRVDWQVVRGQGPQLTDTTAIQSGRLIRAKGSQIDPGTDQGVAAISQAVAILALRGDGDAPRALMESAVAYVVLTKQPGKNADRAAENALVEALDSTKGLNRVTQTATTVTWRVAPEGGDTLERSARVRVVDSSGATVAVLPSGSLVVDTALSARGTGLSLRLAERADAGWQAWLDGKPLKAAKNGWQQGFSLPDNASGHLVIKHVQRSHTVVVWTQAVLGVLLVLLAVPISTRRRRMNEQV